MARNLSTNRWMIIAVLFVSLLSLESTGWAQYPAKEINLVVGFQAGGTTDLGARAIAEPASKLLGQPIVIVNKVGATSAIALSYVKNQKPDGYTLGTISVNGILAQHMMRNVDYDVSRDFTPIIGLSENVGGIVVQADSPWKTLKEFVDYAKANPGKIKFASAGVGSIHHLVMESLGIQEKIQWTHIPFPGAQPAVMAILGGHVNILCSSMEWKPHVESGKLRLLCLYSKKRLPNFPSTPTLIELGYNISGLNIMGILGPKGMPRPIVDKLHGAFKEAMNDPKFRKSMDTMDLVPTYRGPEELGKENSETSEYAKKLIHQLGLRQD